MASDEQVKLIIKAVTDQAVRELNKFNNAVSSGEKKQKKFSKALESGKKHWKKFATVAVASGVAVKGALDLSKEFTKFEQGAAAMRDQFGLGSNFVITELKKISGNTVSSANIVLSANRAMALGVTKDVDKMAKLLEFARLRGRAMGIDTTQAFNDIVTGIGRQCLTADTDISMADGSIKKIVDVKAGDLVLSYKDGEIITTEVSHLHFNGLQTIYKIILVNNQYVKSTDNHRYMTKHGWKFLSELSKGNTVKTATGDVKIKSIERVGAEKVYDLTVPETANFITQNFIVHNSPLILDNLGLITKGWNKEAAAAGKAFNSQFVLNKVLQQAETELAKVGELQETNAEKVQRANATWEDFKLMLGKALLPGLVRMMDAFIDIGEWLTKTAPAAIDKFGQGWVVAFHTLKFVTVQVFASLAAPFIEYINLVIKGLNFLTKSNIEYFEDTTFMAIENARSDMMQAEFKFNHMSEFAEKTKVAAIEAQKETSEVIEKQLEEDVLTWEDWSNNILSGFSSMAGQLQAISTQYFKNQNIGLDNSLKKELKANEQRASSEEELAVLNDATDQKFDKKKRKLAHKQAVLQKKLSIAQATISGAQAVLSAYATPPAPLGMVLATVMAGLTATQIGLIATQPIPAAQEGGIIRGAPGAAGRLIRAGEQGRDEAIIPLEDPEALSRLGGGSTIVLNVETLIGDETLPSKVTTMIDKALFEHKQDGLSRL